MGNRAVITFMGPQGRPPKATATGVYLHWNGGPESVLAFLEAAKRLKIRMGREDAYFFPRFCQIIGNYFGDTLSLGLGPYTQLDDSDNGVYFLDDGLNIVQRSKRGPMTVAELNPEQREKYEAIVQDCMDYNLHIFNRPLSSDNKDGAARVLELTAALAPAVRVGLLEKFLNTNNLFKVLADFIEVELAQPPALAEPDPALTES